MLFYGESGKAEREEYYDANLALLETADGYAVIERRYDAQGRVVWIRYLDANEEPVAVKSIYEKEQSYDEAGNVILEIVYDGSGSRALHPDGWSEHLVAYNENKQKVRERWLGIDGEPALYKKSHSGIDRVFDEAGNVIKDTYYDAEGNVGANHDGVITIERRYDEHKRVVWYRYLDADGLPMAIKGICELEKGYDEAGNVNLEIVYDGNGTRVLHPDGWSEHLVAYNENKQKISERWLGVSGRPALYKSSHSGIDRVFGEDGKPIRETYYDADGNIGPNKSGVITVETSYDAEGRITELRYFDENGQPMVLASLGASIEQRTYDEYGNVCRTQLLDGERRPMIGSKGWAAAEYVFNETKHRLSEAYYGTDGSLILVEGGYAKVTNIYDEAGNKISTTYYDTSGAPAVNARGVATVNRVFGERKTVVYEEYRDAQGNLCLDADAGCAAVSRVLDGDGRIIGKTYFGTDGNVFLNLKKKYASVRWEYDASGRIIAESYFGVEGEPIAVGGRHILVRQYDKAGNVILEQQYDTEGAIITTSQNYATVRRVYDNKKRIIEEQYYDAEGNPTRCKSGYAVQIMTYLSGAKPVSKTFFDVDGSRMEVSGYHQVVYTYDERGGVIMESYFDAQGRRSLCEIGYATVVHTYDPNNEVEDTSYYDVDGRPIVLGTGYARIENIRDERGNVLVKRYYGADGALMPQKNGYAIIVRTFNAKNKVLTLEYRDVEGRLVRATNTRYARIVYEYDEAGNKTAERYYDEYGEPASPKANSPAARTWTYDENGKVLSERYWDAQDCLMVTSSGYAGFVNWYSEDYTVMEQTYLDDNGEIIARRTKMGYCKLRRTYDETGKRLLREEYLDRDGQLTRMLPSLYYGKVCEYDESGRIIREYTIGADGKPYSGRRNYAIIEYSYHENGTRTAAYYTANGNLAR